MWEQQVRHPSGRAARARVFEQPERVLKAAASRLRKAPELLDEEVLRGASAGWAHVPVQRRCMVSEECLPDLPRSCMRGHLLARWK